jgi:alkanesulfonate monooxygenase SsuD/methylene tetrahydromethanopterin reductase-like flavin-dependent oxidoreductase (luciferase family)
MPNYGAPLLFGTFITPSNAQPELPVALARLSEQLDLDLVTFQDHPYQPRFLDTWTLMSWVAAQTSSIHIAPNVLNLPLRPPAVTARAAASLDLLSGGRFALALGAGYFWDAITAMGGRKLTPGHAVDSLSEAIDIVRGIWAAEDPSPLRFDGEYHKLHGVRRGPAPAHDVPLWIGAQKPRMLRLTGRKADGWLPTLGNMQPGEFALSNATIDEAAVTAGRDPRAIRRMANIGGRFTARSGGFLIGPSDQWVDQLLPYVLDDGLSALILASDDPEEIRRFAGEVAPALRAATAAELPNLDSAAETVRSRSARARLSDQN